MAEDSSAPAAKPSRRKPAEKAEPEVKVHAKKASEFEITQRRKQVQRLRLSGKTYDEIAQETGVTVFTVKRDLDAIQEENLSRVDKFKQQQEVGDGLRVFDQVLEHAWEEFAGALKGTKQRLDALHLIRTTQNDKLKAMVEVGLVAKAEQQVTHKHVHQLPWNDEMKSKVIHEMLHHGLQPQFQLPTPDPSHVPGKNLDVIDVEVTPTTEEKKT